MGSGLSSARRRGVAAVLAHVKFLPEGKRVVGGIGESVLATARKANVDFLGPCAGRALCARCVLRVIEGAEHLSEVSADERRVLREAEISQGYRVGCRSRLVGNGEVTVFIPSRARLGTSALLAEGAEPEEKVDPAVVRVKVPVRIRLSDLAGLLDGLQVTFTSKAREGLSACIAAGTETASLVVRGQEVLDVKREGRLLGLAVDLGTTKVAGYLVDLEDGRTLSTATEINPQIAYGEDVIARLAYAMEGGESELQARAVESINSIAERACGAAGVLPADVYEFVVVGNTVMHHLLMKLDPKKIAYAPYTPDATASSEVKGSSLHMAGNEEARVVLPPLVAGYVGSDAVADVLATGMYSDPGPSVLVDIGTNTEIVVKDAGVFLACSAASGPAFEGAHIAFGMRAATGAIDSVEFSADGEPTYTVIGGTRPRGLTGSAVVDVLAGLFKAGIVDRRGTFVKDSRSPRLRTDGRGLKEFVVAGQSETENHVDITVSQRDIREIQLAKAAIRAGVDILMKRAGFDVKDIRVMHVAGAFGFFLDPASARTLGLYPEVELDRVRMVGNTAVTGAKAFLVSKEARKTADAFASSIKYVELAADADFRREFLNAMSIPYVDAGLVGRTHVF